MMSDNQLLELKKSIKNWTTRLTNLKKSRMVTSKKEQR